MTRQEFIQMLNKALNHHPDNRLISVDVTSQIGSDPYIALSVTTEDDEAVQTWEVGTDGVEVWDEHRKK